jgi:hypothetical protein
MNPARKAAKELHLAVANTFASPEGRRVLEFLRTQCFMRPGVQTRQWTGSEQVLFRFGRMTLFQALEYYLDPENFKEDLHDG